MALSDKQKSAALEWARTDHNIQKQFREMRYDLFYEPLIHCGLVAVIICTVFFGWFALGWHTLLVTPDWWAGAFSLAAGISATVCAAAIMLPDALARLKLLSCVAFILPVLVLAVPLLP